MGWALSALLIGIAEMQVLAGSDTMSTFYTLLHPSILNPFDWVLAAVSVITLWFGGTLWTGMWLWVYFIVCIPMSAGVIWVIIQFVGTVAGNILGGITRIFA